jgi:hypothetical protein
MGEMGESAVSSEDLWAIAADREIRRVLATYCHAVDRLDAELMATVFHPDAVDDHGTFYVGPASDFATVCIATVAQRHRVTQHSTTNAIIEVHGRVAAVQSSVIAVHLTADGQGLSYFGGRYLDRFEHRDRTWRIAHRRCIHDWDAGVPWAPGYPGGYFASENEGSRSTDDPSYELFRRVAEGPGVP